MRPNIRAPNGLTTSAMPYVANAPNIMVEGILSGEESRAQDDGKGAVEGKVVPLHGISQTESE
jgi:hypothetical protein